MTTNDIVQAIAESRIDARSLSEFIFKPAGFKVARRLAPDIDTLQFYIDRFDATKATADAYVATIPTIVNDAINNTAVEGGVLADTFVTVTANNGTKPRSLRDKQSENITFFDFFTEDERTAYLTNPSTYVVSEQMARAVLYLNTYGGEIAFDGEFRLPPNTTALNKTLYLITKSGVTLSFSSRTKFYIDSPNAITTVFSANDGDFTTKGTLNVETDFFTGFDLDEPYGAKALVIKANPSKKISGFTIDKINTKRGVSNFEVSGTENRVSDIRIGGLYLDETKYGMNLQGNGDNVTFGIVQSTKAFRSLFAYNCKNVTGKVRVIDPLEFATPLNISNFGITNDTENFNIDLELVGVIGNILPVSLRHICLPSAVQTTRNINVRVTAQSKPSKLLTLYNVDSSNGSYSTEPFTAKYADINVDYVGENPPNIIDISGAKWVTPPSVKVSGVTMGLSTYAAYSKTMNLRVNTSGITYAKDLIALNNNVALSTYDKDGNLVELAKKDSANNIHIGNPTNDGRYTILYGSASVYISVNGTSKVQITELSVSPNTNNDISLGDTARKFSKLHLAGGVGFYGTNPPTSKSTILGSRTDGTALKNLLTALVNCGLIIDSTT